MICDNCMRLENLTRNGKAFCVRCDMFQEYTVTDDSICCHVCGQDVFINRCVLLDVWNIREGEQCEHHRTAA